MFPSVWHDVKENVRGSEGVKERERRGGEEVSWGNEGLRVRGGVK